jgi:hypothetical protein
VFAPNSKQRVLVTPAKRVKGNKARVSDEPQTPTQRRAAMTWAQRLKRVFNIEIQTCSECGGAVKVIACIEELAVVQKILGNGDILVSFARNANRRGWIWKKQDVPNIHQLFHACWAHADTVT